MKPLLVGTDVGEANPKPDSGILQPSTAPGFSTWILGGPPPTWAMVGRIPKDLRNRLRAAVWHVAWRAEGWIQYEQRQTDARI